MCAFAGKTGLYLHGRYATFSWAVRYSFLRGTLLIHGGFAVVPGRYAIRSWAVRYFFLGGTPVMEAPILRLSWAVRYLLPVGGADFRGGYADNSRCGGHRVQLPHHTRGGRIFRALAPPFSSAVRYSYSPCSVWEGQGFMGGTLFCARSPTLSWAVRYSRIRR